MGNEGRAAAAAVLVGVEHPVDVSGQQETNEQKSARKAAMRDAKKNPIVEFFGKASFQLVERKEYPDKQRPNRTNAKLCEVLFPMAGGMLELNASIYEATETGKDAEGPYEDKTVTFSLGKNVKPTKDNPHASRYMDSFRAGVLADYEEWIAKVDASTPVVRRGGSNKGISKRVRPTP